MHAKRLNSLKLKEEGEGKGEEEEEEETDKGVREAKCKRIRKGNGEEMVRNIGQSPRNSFIN